MANGRFERLFAKRKGSLNPLELEIPGPREPTEPLFPSPSYIRPRSSRMLARDEVAVKSPFGRRTQSISTCNDTSEAGDFRSRKLSSAESTQYQLSPTWSSTFSQRRDIDLPNFDHYKIRSSLDQSGASSPRSLASSRLSPTRIPSSRCSTISFDAKSQSPLLRAHTPPTSDNDDPISKPESTPPDEQQPALSRNLIPTPGPSPDITPVSDDKLKDPPVGIDGLLNATLYRNIQETTKSATARIALRSNSMPSLDRLPPRPFEPSGVIREPTVQDFFELSDDDIAEEQPEDPVSMTPIQNSQPAKHEKSGPMPLSNLPFGGPSFPMSTPPVDGSATVAAFEAARIAARYNFDLVYVVNLWPDMGTNCPLFSTPSRGARNQVSTPRPNSADTAIAGSSLSGTSPSLTGRLLAAYGLSTVKSPFCISAGVHAKILQGNGWIEYRNQEAKPDEFARGYACSFYTGQHGRRSSADSAVPRSSMISSQRSAMVDRGIVFAAYRKPRSNDVSKVGCTKAELAAVYQDAEALVEMLLDIHITTRLNQNTTLHRPKLSEPGPAPNES